MHEWYDDWPYWDDLYKALAYINKNVKRYSGCYLVSKEKWGTLRYEHIFSPLYSYRGYKYNNAIGRWLAAVQLRWAYKVLRWSIHRAAKKWPQCYEEIMWDYSHRFTS